jgi:hypothetical protein
MVKPGSDGSEYTRGYQQALDDFGITQLLSGIRSYSDEDFEADRARMTSEFQRWYPPRDLSVESIQNRKLKILKPPHLSVGSI